MSYTYYVPVTSDEHYLYASELAEMFGIYTVTGRPHTQLVSAYLTSLELFEQAAPLFYPTKHGLRRVFRDGANRMELLVRKLKEQPDEIKTMTFPNGKIFKVKLKSKEAGA